MSTSKLKLTALLSNKPVELIFEVDFPPSNHFACSRLIGMTVSISSKEGIIFRQLKSFKLQKAMSLSLAQDTNLFCDLMTAIAEIWKIFFC